MFGYLQEGVLNDGESAGYAFALVNGEYRGLPTVSHSGSLAGYRTSRLPPADMVTHHDISPPPRILSSIPRKHLCLVTYGKESFGVVENLSVSINLLIILTNMEIFQYK